MDCKPMELTDGQLAKLAVKIAAVKDEDIQDGEAFTYMVFLDSGFPKLGKLRVCVQRESPGNCRLWISDVFGWTLARSSSLGAGELFFRLAVRYDGYRRNCINTRGNTKWPEFLRELIKFLKR